MRTRYQEIAPYKTKDGSTIRELLHPSRHEVKNQSLAEAVIDVGTTTRLHRHRTTEEIYHITAGRGRMTLGDSNELVGVGDTILIPPGTWHCIENVGREPLRILCCCAPAYAHEDTELK